MTRHWTAPAVVGVVVAVLTVWLVRAVSVLVADGPGAGVVTEPTVWLVYAAGPAVLCAVPLVVLARAVLPRAGGSLAVYAVLGLVGGLLIGVVQTWVLTSAWPWQSSAGVVHDLVTLPAIGGLVGGAAAGVVRRRRDARSQAESP
ncbi:hypothetical protein [Cellulomonas sp. S1-8]|uniref:hypothetical protein n=1 Tax=Cellulomonas sp. S1-8 TaxID=2904790 RepID=UPI0022443DB4|nr:hypothetical protein [Cellulomonas sp. S1-8]UZN04464.1 hypothetical protein OKX07_05985 [Cellulomonas sp. S1-8]